MIEFFNGYKNVLMFYKGDYGLPIVYTASEFQIDDEIVFCVSGNVIAPKIFTVDALNQGQKKKIIKNEAVKKIFDLYGVKY